MRNNDDQNKKERQLDNLTNIVENHTRTKRHLEQYSEIGDPEYKEMAREKQEKREANRDTMAPQDLQNLQAKQQHREEQLNNL